VNEAMMERDKPEGAVSSVFLHFKKVEVEVNDFVGIFYVNKD